MTSIQSTHKIIMIEPKQFMPNPQTLATNAHQVHDEMPVHLIQKKAKDEHQTLVKRLKKNRILPYVISGSDETPDDLFCNNWISFHQNEPFVLYPMYAPNRRLERRKDLCAKFEKLLGKPIDLTHYEQKNLFLESTGSMVLDRVNKVAYAAQSPRTSTSLFLKWCDLLGYEPVLFNWLYENKKAVYHTNVIVFIGSTLAAICSEGIPKEEREMVLSKLKKHHQVMELSYAQIHSFSGNALEVKGEDKKTNLVMSTSAFNAYDEAQHHMLKNHFNEVIHSDIPTIEKYGGGSARCMILEHFT